MYNHTGKELKEYPGDLLKVIGVLILVGPPSDERATLSDTQVIGAVHSMNLEAAEKNLLNLADEYLEDNGPVPEGYELRLDFASWIKYH